MNTGRFTTIALLFIFFLCFFSPSAAAYNGDDTDLADGSNELTMISAPINPEFLKWQEERLSNGDLAVSSCDGDSCTSESVGDSDFYAGEIPSPLMIADTMPGAGMLSIEADFVSLDDALPSSYDLRNEGRVTDVRDQQDCGSCWTFAAMASLESYLLGNEGTAYDLSENNMKNKHGFVWGCCDGGNRDMATAYLTRWDIPDDVTWYAGPVSEANDSYDDESCTSPADPGLEKHVQNVYFLPDQPANDNDLVKTMIQDYGAVAAHIYWNSLRAISYDTAAPSYYFNSSDAMVSMGGHAIALVGWDDSYSKTNFQVEPPGDGAYIARNSWGTTWGNDSGYFWISYYDGRIYDDITVFTGEETDNYDRTYYYDQFGTIGLYTADSTLTGKYANNFTAMNDMTVEAVSFVTSEADAQYRVDIYKNPDSGAVNTTTGSLSNITGTLSIPGYHTLELSDAVEVDEGEDFTVVVEVTNPSYKYTIPVEYNMVGYLTEATAAAKGSYVYYGGSWHDLHDTYSDRNVCVRAFTTDGHASSGTAPVANFTATPANGYVPLEVSFMDNSTNTPTSWNWTFGDGNSSAVQNPVYTYPDMGVYNVTLTVTNAYGSDSEIKYAYINVTGAAPGYPEAELDLNRNNIALLNNDSFSPGIYTAPVTYRPHIQNYDDNITLGNISERAVADNITGVEYEAFATWNFSYVEWDFPEIVAIGPGEGFDTRVYTSTSEDVFYNHTITRSCNETIFTSPGVQHVNLTVNFGDKDFESVFIGLWPAKNINVTGMIVNGSVYTDAPLDPVPGFSGDEHIRLDRNALVTGYDYHFSYDVTVLPNASASAVMHKPMAYVWEGIEHETWNPTSANTTLEVPADMLAYDASEFSVTTNTSCDWSITTQDNYLSVLEGVSEVVALPKPVADFSANVTSGRVPLVVQFTDLSTLGAINPSWSFGDGDTSNEKNPVHTYSSPGTYNVMLVVSNAAGSDTETKFEYINVSAPKDMPELIIPDITLGWGNSTVIPVMVVNMTNGTGISGTFTWDSSVINVTSITSNSTVFTGSVISTNITGNSGIISLTNTDEMSATSPVALFDISVIAVGSDGDKSYISGTDTYWSDITFDRFDLACTEGSVEISGVKGDFNGNGYVDIGDVSKVAYMVAGKTDIDMRADFNGNGEVDVGDAAKIAWSFIGKIAEL